MSIATLTERTQTRTTSILDESSKREVRRAILTASMASGMSADADRKLNRIAGADRGSADEMWIEPVLSGRIGCA